MGSDSIFQYEVSVYALLVAVQELVALIFFVCVAAFLGVVVVYFLALLAESLAERFDSTKKNICEGDGDGGPVVDLEEELITSWETAGSPPPYPLRGHLMSPVRGTRMRGLSRTVGKNLQ